MRKIIIETKNDDELDSLEAYLNRNGISFKTEAEYRLENQKEMMKVFSDMVSNSPKIDISVDDIDSIVEEVRTKPNVVDKANRQQYEN